MRLLRTSISGQVQKKILGDIREQKISQVYDEDAREEKVYRRPPTFLVIASKIVRPSTVYQVHLASKEQLDKMIPLSLRDFLA